MGDLRIHRLVGIKLKEGVLLEQAVNLWRANITIFSAQILPQLMAIPIRESRIQLVGDVGG
jgi:hypothetical protein